MRTIALRDCCQFLSGGTPSKAKPEYWSGGIPWFSPKDIKSFELHDSQDHISENAIDSSATRVLPAGAVFVVGRSGVLAHTLPVGVTRQASAFNQDIKAILPEKDFDSEFIALFIKSMQAHVLNQGVKIGATVHSLKSGFIEALEVPKIVVGEQRRIAARLKAQLAVVEDARRAAQAQARDAEVLGRRIHQDTLGEMFGFPRVALQNLLSGIESGKSFQTSDRLAKTDELGVLKVSAVSWKEFNSNEAKAIDGDYQPDIRHVVKAGDVLISRANTVDLVGAVVRVPKDFPNRLLSDKTLRLLVNEGRAYPDYLIHVLRMTEARAHIESNATGTSDSMRNISQDTIRSIPIALPSLGQQRQIASRLDAVDKALGVARRAINDALAELDRLPARLLAQAFSPMHEEESP